MAEDIYEQIRRVDFNRTEPETLSQLIEKAIKIGDEIKDDYVRLRQLTDDILEILKRENLIRSCVFSKEELSTFHSKVASASDGSFQSVGGVDGIWYIPISVSLVVFPRGIENVPEIKVGAHIQKIDERRYPNLGAAMEKLMLTAETSMIKDWARECPKGVIHFIDGPIIDPPYQMSKDYTTFRVDAIQKCLNKSALILGCVKKLLGNYLIDYLTNIIRDYEKDRLNQFVSDAHLIYHVFTKTILQGGNTVYSKPIEIPDSYPIYKPYKEKGLKIYFMYFQRYPQSNPFRVDISVRSDKQIDTEQLGEKVAAVLSAWSYPGYDLPLPIVIAHDKCNIRKGCAEVLYSEVITRTASSNMFDNLVKSKLRREVL